ncbi:phage terminase large subunit family protein [Pinibacter soli]|uniref:Phage terminase large subunit family protein n=1 Tax=Pinibacter soli TaxID=3044211 RepID=A0ABT6RC53_9BACT|nr:terminase gpA endonuclease subunit [Pinibacter soli]MDI3319980.1 phage terminase large subunit family protein [Pinibacter soli]
MFDGIGNIDFSLVAAFQKGITPDPTISCREWADTYRFLPSTSARPGKFSSEFTPYVQEIMERLSVYDTAQKVIVKKSSQTGLTETGNNWLGYVIDMAPAPFLYVMPTDMMMKETSKKRIATMIASTPALNAKISVGRSRDQSNTLLYKEFPNGFVKMVGANSPNGLSSDAVRFVYMDETDRYPASVDGEGSAEGLAETRTITFGSRKKIFLTSTPTRKGESFIDQRFETTGQRYYHVPCPFCGEYQRLVIEQIRYEAGNYKTAKYECEHCKELIEERFKARMLKQGKWVAKYPEREDGLTYGYFINALYSPSSWYPWSQLIRERDESENDIPKKIVFTNTKLGEAYEEENGEKLDWEGLFEKAIEYEPNKPFTTVAFLTAGVDVQADRLEIEIVGWMKGKISQSVDYRVIIGDTSQSEVWAELGKILGQTWIREDNAIMPLRLMAIDTGYNTEKVYDFAQKHGVSRVIPVKGKDNLSVYYSAPQSIDIAKAGKKIGKIKVWGVGVSLLKSELYGLLKKRINAETGEVPEGYCYFPKREPSYFRGLTAEELVSVVSKKGSMKYEWHKKYKRNEPLDCRNYARAAAAMIGLDRWSNDRWDRERDMYEINVPEEIKPTIQKSSTPKKKSNFWK